MTTRSGVVALTVCGSLACTAYSTLKTAPVDCSVMNAYDLDIVDSQFMMTYGSHDHTTDAASANPSVEPIPGGALCGDTTGLHVVGASYNDWGSLFGFYGFGKKDESAREGMSFWARAPGNGQKGITILLDDPNTTNPAAVCPADAGAGVVTVIPPGDGGAYCTTYCTPDAGSVTATPPAFDPSNGMPLSSGASTAPLPENACSNSYQTEISLTADWAFYTIPFSQFQQQATPDRVPNAALTKVGSSPQTKMLTSSISNVTFRLPKGSPYELWFDRVGFYSRK